MYKLILFHPEGDWVTDGFTTDDLDRMREYIAELGSKWIFYPFPFVFRDGKAVETPPTGEYLEGKTVAQIQALLQDYWNENAQEICDMINIGTPFHAIYPSEAYIGVFKDESAFDKKEGLCYVPDNSNRRYSYDDFVRIAHGNEQLARIVFDLCEWEHPETVIDRLIQEGEIENDDFLIKNPTQ